jgi:hypothetical protein
LRTQDPLTKDILMRLLVVSFVASLCLAPSALMAQSPYSPLAPDTAKLMTTGRFERSPIKLPFPQDNVASVARNSRQDFEHIYNVPFTEVMAWLQLPQNNKDGFEIIDPAVYPAAAGLKFKLMSAVSPTGGTLVFEHPTLSRRIILEFIPRGAQTAVVFQNQVLTDLFSGVMPSRQGFIPAGVDTIVPFNWN